MEKDSEGFLYQVELCTCKLRLMASIVPFTVDGDYPGMPCVVDADDDSLSNGTCSSRIQAVKLETCPGIRLSSITDCQEPEEKYKMSSALCPLDFSS
ncbi:hypothetical protein OUZ56_016933 [Daphnia magna]|uniref:Uncharacterized protein n=1 Tax=Daphnia magna TaxID=35525 RepID=A0ABR0ARP3_9CRUS|nr:hypothetical protein OUZ56_016933 [Daphnia magna]